VDSDRATVGAAVDAASSLPAGKAHRALWPACLAALLSLLCLPAPAKTAAPPFWGFALDGYPVTEDRLLQLEAQTGLFPQLVVFFLQWPAPGESQPFPAESLEVIWSRGAVPCLTWEPMFIREGQEVTISAAAILGGQYDDYLRRFAEGARLWGRPFLIRFAHEMNLDRYHWGTEREGYGPQSPQLYRRLFRYVVDRFRRAGADNVRWVFCPNAESVPNPSLDAAAFWNRPEAYFPGADVVDILGMDGYNWGTTRRQETDGWTSRWQSFTEIFTPLYGILKDLAPDKPLLVFETACVTEGGDRREWLRAAFRTAERWNLRGISWFQADKEAHWGIDGRADAEAVRIIRQATSAARFWIEREIR
jgi:hypothetical protein